jgi:hypothetical protein
LNWRPQVWPAAHAAFAVHTPPPPVQSDSAEQARPLNVPPTQIAVQGVPVLRPVAVTMQLDSI